MIHDTYEIVNESRKRDKEMTYIKLCCLLQKTRVKDKTYMWVSVSWKTKDHFHRVVFSTILKVKVDSTFVKTVG